MLQRSPEEEPLVLPVQVVSPVPDVHPVIEPSVKAFKELGKIPVIVNILGWTLRRSFRENRQSMLHGDFYTSFSHSNAQQMVSQHRSSQYIDVRKRNIRCILTSERSSPQIEHLLHTVHCQRTVRRRATTASGRPRHRA